MYSSIRAFRSRHAENSGFRSRRPSLSHSRPVSESAPRHRETRGPWTTRTPRLHHDNRNLSHPVVFTNVHHLMTNPLRISKPVWQCMEEPSRTLASRSRCGKLSLELVVRTKRPILDCSKSCILYKLIINCTCFDA